MQLNQITWSDLWHQCQHLYILRSLLALTARCLTPAKASSWLTVEEKAFKVNKTTLKTHSTESKQSLVAIFTLLPGSECREVIFAQNSNGEKLRRKFNTALIPE